MFLTDKRRFFKYLVVGFAAISALLYARLFWPEADAPGLARFGLVTAGLLTAYTVILLPARRFSFFGLDRRLLFALAAFAILLRVVVIAGADHRTYPSPNACRCVWEGKLVAHGYNPYTTSPQSPGGSGMADDALYPYVAQPELASNHPPLAQYLFMIAYYLHSDSVDGFRVLSFLFELLTLLGIVLLAAPMIEKRPFHSWSVLIYAFSPLVIIEFLLSLHADILAMPFFLFALVYLRRGKGLQTGILLALAAMVKLFALAFVPVILFHFLSRERWRFSAGLIVTLALIASPFLLTGGTEILRSSLDHLRPPEFNSSVYALIETVVGDPTTARAICGALFLTVIAAASYPLRNRLPKVTQRLFLVAGAYIILTPSLAPSQLLWVMPFLVLFRNIPFLILSATILLSYYGLSGLTDQGLIPVSVWISLLQYGPFYILLLYPVLARLLRRRETDLTATS